MKTSEFTETINQKDLTPRKLIEVLKKIPEEYQDDLLDVFIRGEYCHKIEIAMVVDDAECSRAKWRAGDPDYLLFMDIIE